MALVVETGTGADPTANTYVDRAGFIAYALSRGVTIADDVATDVFLIKAMDYLSMQKWGAQRTNFDYTDDPNVAVVQPLDWPRNFVVVFPGWYYPYFGYEGWPTIGQDGSLPPPANPIVGNNEIPGPVKVAQSYLAMLSQTGFELNPAIAGGGPTAKNAQFVKGQRLGPIQRDFSEQVALSVNYIPFIPLVNRMLLPYLTDQGLGVTSSHRL
jgi:hypothetical protein